MERRASASHDARKFHSVHRFGKKRKKSLIANIKNRRAPATSVEDGRLSVPSIAAAEPAAIGLTAPPACESAGGSGRVRLDTKILQPAELQENARNAEAKLQELASTSATKRKQDRLAAAGDGAAADSPDNVSFVVVSLDSVNDLLRCVKCKTCGGDVNISKCDREYGLAVKLLITCVNCGDISSAWSSPRVAGDQNINPFSVNILAARAMQSTGNRQTALNDIFSAMNISHRGLHTKTWQNYVKKKLAPAVACASEELMTECASSVRELYSELDTNIPGNIAVSYDGSWMTRGHSSHIGVGTVIELFTGFVLDYVVLSNFCAACEQKPNENDPSYQTWVDNHHCQKNTSKKAGEMEVEAALILFQRSLSKHNLRYTTVLSDGDSRAYLALQEEKVYGYMDILKEDCVNHVQKRMGTNLRKLLSQHKGHGLGGKGRLTGDLVNKLTSYYGWALKSHKGDVEATHRAVMATYLHVTSRDGESNHSLCPTGPDSWCRQNAAEAKGQPPPKHRYSLPAHVCEALLPVYERLSDRKLLERCQRGKTQNNNESLHSMIWALAPKERHASLFTVEAAVGEAVMKFNAGYARSATGILKELSLTPGRQNSKRLAEKDKRRMTASARKHASAENVKQALRKRHRTDKNQQDYVPGGY